MKKFLILALVICMSFSVAAAETDLKSLSFDELTKLQQQVAAEIMSRPEWKEVTVPIGEWRVGVDIPAGVYGVSTDSSSSLINVWRSAVDDFTHNGLIINQVIRKGQPYGRLTLEDGWVFVTSKPVVFTPPISLGF